MSTIRYFNRGNPNGLGDFGRWAGRLGQGNPLCLAYDNKGHQHGRCEQNLKKNLGHSLLNF